MKNAKCYIIGYPRPQFVRENWESLDGEWDFLFDDNNIGEKEKWFIQFPKSMKINVPFAYQTKKSGIYKEEYHEVLWYAKQHQFSSLKENERIIINFEGSDYLTKVWVNGIFVGEHAGGYCRFSFDITHCLDKNGSANIVCRIEDDNSCTKPRGKQTWKDEAFGCWYLATSGIWKSVWVEKVSETRISRIKMTPVEETYHVMFEYEIENFKKGYTLKTVVSYEGNIIAENELKLVRNNHTYSIDFTNDIDGFKIHWWTPQWPHIYDVKFYLLDENGNVIDEVGSYTAFRIFKTENNLLKLNLNPIYLRMVLEQGYWRESGLTAPSEKAIIDELLICQELGFNGIRMHQKIDDERFYYFADMMGMMVWCEMPSNFEFKDKSIENVSKEWMEVVKQHYNHPSIITWVPVNESWGVNRLTTNKNEQHLTQSLYHLTKAYDSIRPVIANDGWEHTTSDIITLHNYAQDADELLHFYEDINRMLDNKNINDYTQLRTPFVNGFKYNGQPVMVDEFAGIGYQKSSDEGWGYGDKVTNEKDYLDRLSSLVKALRKCDTICGFCVTQITDVYQEINGLLDFDRNYKANKDSLRKALTQK